MSNRRYYARKLFELSGLVPVGAFLLEHLYSNFQAVGPGGRERFDKVVVDLQTNPLILFLEVFAIALPLLYHAGYGLYVAQQARPNAGEYGYLRNWTYVFQRITGIVLFLYIGYHVWNTRFYPLFHAADPTLQHVGDAAMVSSSYMHRYLGEAHGGVPVFWIYVVGVSCAAYHFANGVWNAGVHWGLFMSATAQRLAGWACLALGAGLAFLGIESLLAFTKMGA
jgi:succinate dehydrogenase / fumarate reductase, cytochrome b subunit